MPLFLCQCFDLPDVLEKRHHVHDAHLQVTSGDRAAGRSIIGRTMLDAQGAVIGSTMIYRFPTLSEAWTRLRSDIYLTEGVWDPERCSIIPLGPGPNDETLYVADKR